MTEHPPVAYTPEHAPVLVAVLNNQQDFQRAHDEGWYRIPLKRAPRRIAAEFMAFYQTSAFGAQGCAVNFYASVRRFQIVSRRELLPAEADHPRAEELYYRVELGPLQRLTPPIASPRLRRVTFIATTLGRLLAAREISDLWQRDDLQERLWAALREAGLLAEFRYQVGGPPDETLIDFALFCREGRIAVLCESSGGDPELRERRPAEYDLAADGWRVLAFDARWLAAHLDEGVAQVSEAVEQLGGQLPPGESD